MSNSNVRYDEGTVMKILGIDSSGLVASVAIVQDDVTIAEYSVNYKKTHSQTLLPMLNEVTTMTEQDLSTIDAIAVSTGPGSFTGLRIGSATAKGLAEALGKPIIPVKTVDSLAYNLYGTNRMVCPLMDARRNQTYTGLFHFVKEDNKYLMKCDMEQCVVTLDAIIEKINDMGKEVIFLGDGVPAFYDQLKEKISVEFMVAPCFCNRQRASVVASLGMILYQEGKIQTPEEHAPEYLRLSQAERERKEAAECSL